MFTSLYLHNRKRSESFATINLDDSMTQKDDAKDCDINIIMKRYAGGGQMPTVIKEPLYGDFTNNTDYRTMVETVQAADAAFQEIPADVRKRFMNDPQEFINFIRNPDNLEDMRKLGLAVPKAEPPKPPEPMLVRVVPEPQHSPTT